jgi:rfaE bifunctional protein nucleotidyltransferase chain/domain
MKPFEHLNRLGLDMTSYTEKHNRVIFTNGCFDLLHLGHMRFLQACKDIGGYLVVGINSDSSVKRLKGEHRPIMSELERKYMLLSLGCVDEVIVFIEDTPVVVINELKPEIYVKSDEYQNVDLPEFRAVKQYGGQIAIVEPSPLLRDIHTSSIIERIFDKEMERRCSK